MVNQLERAAKKREGVRGALRAGATLGPVAVAFTTYGLLVDHLPQMWFTNDVIRYTLALLAAAVMGLGLRALLQAVPTQQRITLPAPTRRPSKAVHDLREDVHRLLLERQRSVPDRADLPGWCQFLGDALSPSAIGTSYGLRLVVALDLSHSRFDRRRLVETLLELELPGGGWASRSQRRIARPEVTSWVLASAVRAGLEQEERTRLVQLLERIVLEDEAGLRHTCVLTSVVSALTEAAPSSVVLAELAGRLAAGSASGGWGRLVGEPSGPTASHTARATIALRRAAGVLSDHRGLEIAAREGTAWLITNHDFKERSERVQRQVGADLDTITIDHFTAAWVARALLAADDPHPPLLRAAVREVLAAQQNGIWTWENRQPVWMAYQAMSVLREYALRNLPWPP